MINKIFTIFAFSLMSSLSYAMEEAQPICQEKEISFYTRSSDFNALSYDERWKSYNELVIAFCDQNDTSKRFKEIAAANAAAKDKRIESLLKEKSKPHWKTIGITFVCTVGGLAVLGQFINKKK